MRTIKASEFKARCLAILDEVERTGEPVVISKRGRPVAEVIRPRRSRRDRFPQDELRGTGRTLGDIISPAVPTDEWEATRGPRR
ncbi:MAG: type II toxin-antitoxin system Phd/YefM family antitoxin [Candidatus Binatia bacterium]